MPLAEYMIDSDDDVPVNDQPFPVNVPSTYQSRVKPTEQTCRQYGRIFKNATVRAAHTLKSQCYDCPRYGIRVTSVSSEPERCLIVPDGLTLHRNTIRENLHLNDDKKFGHFFDELTIAEHPTKVMVVFLNSFTKR